ncbi:hypothetical protein J2Z79_002385 [Symbiobacterium terraclitae]|uniref:Uncharacterized protein n=1 Tax=Symbiobacterium terraclitae TaxID=557451 RepID=A0ABS4JTV7_9FIRM|nr:hypothetical protein [Symbiobacterium terraclitae]
MVGFGFSPVGNFPAMHVFDLSREAPVTFDRRNSTGAPSAVGALGARYRSG